MQLKHFLPRSPVALFCLLFLFAGKIHSAPLEVLVSILPQQYFAEQIGGEWVQVTVLVGPGSSPENYEPSLQQMHWLSRARLYWRIGLPFEEVLGLDNVARKSTMTVLDARQGITLREMENLAIVLAENVQADDEQSHEGGDEKGVGLHEDELVHGHLGADPHFWLNPRNVKLMGAEFKNALINIDPEHGDEYEANYQRFAAELDQLDAAISLSLDGLQQRRFMVFHPAWGYFADAYGLRQVPIEIEGKSPGPKSLAAIIQLARQQEIKVIFVQRQFSQRNAQTIARAIGGRVVVVDPLSGEYRDNLRRVAQVFAEAMR